MKIYLTLIGAQTTPRFKLTKQNLNKMFTISESCRTRNNKFKLNGCVNRLKV